MKVNTKLLRTWLKNEKKTNRNARIDLAKNSNISSSYLEKILAGKKVPSPNTRFRLAHVTGIEQSLLFTSLDSKEEEIEAA